MVEEAVKSRTTTIALRVVKGRSLDRDGYRPDVTRYIANALMEFEK